MTEEFPAERAAGGTGAAPVSAMIFTLNEELHLPFCLAALDWCDDIVVVDSFSTDRTEEICRNAGARFYQHAFEGFGSQRNWALSAIPLKHDWVLILDADERTPPELVVEMGKVLAEAPEAVAAFRIRRRFYMWGRWLRYSSLYPTWVVRLIHKKRVRYIDRGHAETQEVEGEVQDLQADLIDENLKGVDEWFERQNRYSRKDAEYELREEGNSLDLGQLFSGDPLQRRAMLKRLAGRMPGRGFLYFIYAYIWRRGFLDGRDGYMFCRMRSIYQTMIEIKKYDGRRALISKARRKI